MIARSLIVLAALAMSGCGTTTRLIEAPRVQMPASMRAGCEPLPAAPARGATFGDVYAFAGVVVGMYGECAARDAAKASWVKSQGQ